MTQTFDHTWRKARKRDRHLIQSTFACAAVRHGSKTAPDWEREVQLFFRRDALTAVRTNRNKHEDRRFLIGVDDQGVAAALTHRRMPTSDYEHDLGRIRIGFGDHPVREIAFLGVHLRHRHSGGAVADDALDTALHDILDREPEADLIYVIGRADYRNNSSMRMLDRNGFTQLKPGVPPPQEDTRLSWWARPLARPADTTAS
ncbi:hypothetical protein ACIRQY_33575 [Streptomyces sp. NPDC101490]|uniref:hypothetical protein n=1 Tax=Streptomyces sp. NPDC101490 TaxID=3366143 RepID=UPI003813EFEC